MRAAALLGHLPGPLLRAVGGPPRTNDRGDVLDPVIQAMLALQGRLGLALDPTDPARARRQLRRMVRLGARPGPAVPTEDLSLPCGVRARRYGSAGPLLVWLHGGGWCTGDLDTHDAICRRFAAAGLRVIAPDYRLAPEHPFPAGLEDALDALAFARATEAGPVLAGGDSAGGNLAVAACIALRDRGLPLPDGQVLVYPATDLRRGQPSHRLFAEGLLLTARAKDGFVAHYGAPDLRDPRVSPLLVADARCLPPAFVVTAGFDPLRDEGEEWVARLREAGVVVRHLELPTLIHGFLQMDAISPVAAWAVERVVVGAASTPGTPPRS